MITVKFATNKDRMGIDKITEEFSDHEYSHPPQYFDNALLTKNVLIASDNNQVIGYLIFHILWGNTPFIELLRVTASYQRKGVGSNLLQEFEKEMKQNGYEEIVSSSEKVNEVGNNWHKKQGFEVIGEVNMVYGKEIFYLEKLH